MGLAGSHDSKVEAFLSTVDCVSLLPGFVPCSKKLDGRGQASNMTPLRGAPPFRRSKASPQTSPNTSHGGNYRLCHQPLLKLLSFKIVRKKDVGSEGWDAVSGTMDTAIDTQVMDCTVYWTSTGVRLLDHYYNVVLRPHQSSTPPATP